MKLKLFLLLISITFFACGDSFKDNYTYSNVTLKLINFIGDCQIDNRASNVDVRYKVYVTVKA